MKTIISAVLTGSALGGAFLLVLLFGILVVIVFHQWIKGGEKRREVEQARALAREVATSSRLIVRKSRRPILLDPKKTNLIGSADMAPQNSDAVFFKVGHEQVGSVHCKIYLKENPTRPNSWFVQGAGEGPVELKEGAAAFRKIVGRRKLKTGQVLRLGGAGGPEFEVEIF